MDAVAEPDWVPAMPLPRPRIRLKPGPGIPEQVAGERLRSVLFHGTKSTRVGRTEIPSLRSASPAVSASQEIEGANFLRRVLSRAGLDAAHYRIAPLLRRLPALLRSLRVESFAAAEELLRCRPMLVPKALESLLIGTTEWFRDEPVFEQLEKQVLPMLLHRTDNLRVWSAGASEGLELYSLAVLLAKCGRLSGSHLLGSDCRVEAIDRAERGIYGARPLPASMNGYWQHDSEGRISIVAELRRMVRWELADILTQKPTRAWDLILCRNVAIYLEPAAAEGLWRRLAERLAPGGFLVVGKAERPRLPGLARFGHSIYQKCNEPTSP